MSYGHPATTQSKLRFIGLAFLLFACGSPPEDAETNQSHAQGVCEEAVGIQLIKSGMPGSVQWSGWVTSDFGSFISGTANVKWPDELSSQSISIEFPQTTLMPRLTMDGAFGNAALGLNAISTAAKSPNNNTLQLAMNGQMSGDTTIYQLEKPAGSNTVTKKAVNCSSGSYGYEWRCTGCIGYGERIVNVVVMKDSQVIDRKSLTCSTPSVIGTGTGPTEPSARQNGETNAATAAAMAPGAWSTCAPAGTFTYTDAQGHTITTTTTWSNATYFGNGCSECHPYFFPRSSATAA